MRRLLPMLALLGAALPALAQESLLVGRVESVTLRPSGTEDCPKPCPALSTTDARGVTHVCISTSGGCQKTLFHTEQVLLGDERTGPRVFEQRTGEFGMPRFPVTSAPVLVYLDRDGAHPVALIDRNGSPHFLAKQLQWATIGGVAIASLTPDANGEIALDALTGRFPATH